MQFPTSVFARAAGRRAAALLLALPLAFAACESDSPTVGTVPAAVERVAGDAQAGVRLQALPTPLSVRVVDDRGRPVPNATVAWSTTARASTITAVQAVTDMEGMASASWTLGDQVGEQKAFAAVQGAAGMQVEFTATSGYGRPNRVLVLPEHWIATGDTTRLLSYAYFPDRAPHDISVPNPAGTWSTSSPAVATVEGSKVTGTGPGDVYVRLTVEGVSDSVLMHVRAPLRASAVAVRGDSRDWRACAVNQAQQIACWGFLEGQDPVARPFPGSTRFASLSTGTTHTCALDVDGGAWCWGENGSGQLGTGGTAAASAPTPVAGGLRFTQIAAGEAGTCGLTDYGSVFCWGLNDHGQVGDGTRTTRTVPTPAALPAPLTRITVGGKTACGLTAEGRAYCWGARAHSSPVPVAVFGTARFVDIDLGRNSTCTVDADGRAGCTGALFGATPPPLIDAPVRFTRVATGAEFGCGLTAGGEGWCWGDNFWGQLGSGTRSAEFSLRPVRVATGLVLRSIDADHSEACANAVSGEVVCWGKGRDAGPGMLQPECGPRLGLYFCRATPRRALAPLPGD